MKDNEKDKQVGQKIRRWRKSAGLTQAQLASMIGLTQGAVTSYENRKRSVPLETAQKIADVLNVPITEIIDLDECDKINREPSKTEKPLTDGEIAEAYNLTGREFRTLINFMEAHGYGIKIDIDKELIEGFAEENIPPLGYDYIKKIQGYSFAGNNGGETVFGYHIELTVFHGGKRIAVTKDDLKALNEHLQKSLDFYLFCLRKERDACE